MGKITDLQTFKNELTAKQVEKRKAIIDRPQVHDLNELIKRAKIFQRRIKESSGVISRFDLKELGNFFEGKITDTLMKSKLLEGEYFLCGIYISNLLSGLALQSNIPKSWFAIDYAMRHNFTNAPEFLKKGADTCFLLCSVFKERTGFRSMTLKDYIDFGTSMYSQFYAHTGKEIAFHMAVNYDTMVEVTDECLRTL